MRLSVCSFIFVAMPALVGAGTPDKAVAVLHPTQGNSATGVVTFTQVAAGVHITAQIEGLTPGKHGFHIHQFGDCSGADGKTAGGHFNPKGHPHGAPAVAKRHVGDLGNVEADDKGMAKVDHVDTHARFTGPASILGRGVIVHAKADDLKSQPTGAAGSRVACGVIGVAKSN